MANLSDAYGKVEMKKEFYEKYKEPFKQFFETYSDYGLYSDFEPTYINDIVEITFGGCGRWSLENTLNWCRKCFEEETGVIFEGIWEYDEYECGCEILANVHGDLRHGLEYDDYDYTDYNKIKLDFEEGIIPNNYIELKDYIKNDWNVDLYSEVTALKDVFFDSEDNFYKKFYSMILSSLVLAGGITDWRLEEIFVNLDVLCKALSNTSND